MDEEVREVRDENKERMLHLLIQKIENRKSKPSVRFHFEEGMSYEEKYRLVNEWWNDFRFHLAMAVKSPGELNRFLGNSLSSETMYLLYRARKKGMPFFATPYYSFLLFRCIMEDLLQKQYYLIVFANLKAKCLAHLKKE